MLPKSWHVIDENIINNTIVQIPNDTIPERTRIFRAFTFFPPADTKVIILGQEPYKEGADGLAFSTHKHRQSSRKIMNCLLKLNLARRDSDNGSLIEWARQGVLLLNTILICDPKAKWWYPFTSAIIEYLLKNTNCLVFAWGEAAKKMMNNISGFEERVLFAPHPAANGVWCFPHFNKVKINWDPVPNIKIYTDGACSKNGRKDGKAGYAAIFENFHIRSINGLVRPYRYVYDKQIGYENVEIKPTNNRGELLAIIIALYIITSAFDDADIEIVSDSYYAINIGSDWMYTWIENGYIRENMDLVKILYDLSKPFKIKYTFQVAHIKNPKTPNELGNRDADLLAKEAAKFPEYKTNITRVWEF